MKQTDRPIVTVAIPSSGTRRTIIDTVASIGSGVSLPFELDILVVWSGRTTPPPWAKRLPDWVRQRFEESRGLSRAKNAALWEARGQLVAFTEDDAVCLPRWIRALYSGWNRGEVAVVGGPVIVVWPKGRPAWATANAEALLGFGISDGVAPDLSRQMLVGGNMAVDRTKALELGGFNESLGHGAGTGLMGEETEFLTRVHEAGLRVEYLPEAVVEHHIDSKAATRRNYLLRMHRLGRTLSLLHPTRQASIPRLALKGLTLAGGAIVSSRPTERLARALFVFGSIAGQGTKRRGL